jgi:hypothetical protein
MLGAMERRAGNMKMVGMCTGRFKAFGRIPNEAKQAHWH